LLGNGGDHPGCSRHPEQDHNGRRRGIVKELILILMSGVLVNNYVIQQFLGICPFLGVSKKLNQATGMGIAVTFVIICATLATSQIYTWVLAPLKLEYLQTIVFILVIAALVQFVEIVLKRFIPSLHKSLGIYLPLITTNCAVLGVTINNITAGYGFLESMVSSLGVGLGFLLAMVLFAGVRSRIENCPSPKAFKGVPITLIAASIVALAFYGFAGVVENILGI
jgi:electron transport complex protein RnfA